MGVATRLGPFSFFVGVWVLTTIAIMLPDAAQRLLPPKAPMDVALALGLLTLGIVVAF